jgi:hypothetical protein
MANIPETTNCVFLSAKATWLPQKQIFKNKTGKLSCSIYVL